MSRRRNLILAVLIVAALSFSCLILPGRIASIYTSIMLPLALFLGFVLAFKVALIYGKVLRKSFLFLSLFLLLYILSHILILWQFLYSLPGNYAILLLLLLQVTDYAMLITSCVYTLRVIEVKRMNRYAWISLGMMFALCVYIVAYAVPAMMSAISLSPVGAVSRMMVRIFDMSIILMLTPVLLLYLQHLRAKAQESVTFTLIMGGLIFSLISTYIFQLVTGMPLDRIAAEYFQKGSLLDAIYIFGYLIIAFGLYANMKYDEWGFKAIERALG